MLTTAGHLVERIPCPVYKRQQSFWRGDSFERIGSIQVFNDPKRAAGVDIAAIEMAEPCDGGHPAAVTDPATLAELDVMTLNGGRSKLRNGWIMGALSVTRAMDQRTWKNCWNIVGLKGGFAQPGDSGGPVVLQKNKQVAGHLVGALGATHDDGVLQCGVVQDAETIRSHLESAYNTSVTVLDRGLDF